MFRLTAATIALCLLAAGCASNPGASTAANGTFQAVGPDLTAALPARPVVTEYHLGPMDKISLAVFQMPDLTFPELQISPTGQVALPLIGPPLVVSGLTVDQARDAIAGRLKECCLVNPQVVVTLKEALSQQVTVTGAVKAQGVIGLRGPTTLQQVVAMAGGPVTELADLKNVGVIRYTNGVRTIAKFNLENINKGRDADPPVMAGDVVYIDSSGSKSAFHTVLQGLPLIGLFTLF
ncbi:MAG: polysaccharide biosynthesis/export family protein [Alphaproteobacteria bacterium]